MMYFFKAGLKSLLFFEMNSTVICRARCGSTLARFGDRTGRHHSLRVLQYIADPDGEP